MQFEIDEIRIDNRQTTTLANVICPILRSVTLYKMKRSREPEEEYPDSPDDLRLEAPAQPAAKITELDESAIDTSSDVAMRCSLPPHREVLSFTTYGDFDAHYSKSHTNRCAECSKNFPSGHLLNVHFEDCHDVFAAVKREKGEHTVRHYPFCNLAAQNPPDCLRA